MRDFAYIDTIDNTNLYAADCRWLRESGLRETQWILDAAWFMTRQHMTFNIWIYYK